MSAPAAGVSRSFRPDIEGLRAVAILAVLAFHSEIPGFGGGFIGVDVFFVISGFLITGLLVRQFEAPRPAKLRVFYARRIRRLLPAALVVLLVTAVAVRVWVPALEWQRTGWDIVGAAAYVANFVFAFQATEYLGEGLAASPVQHYWSLGVEEQFYLLWPVLVLAVVWFTRRRGMTSRRWLIVTLAVLTALSFGLSLWQTTASPVWAFFAPWCRAWQFGLGGLIALTSWSWLARPARGLLSIGGLALVLLGVVLIGTESSYPGWWALLPTLGSAAIITAGTGRPEHPGPVGALLRSRAATATGRISYSWYLWHWPPLAIITMMLGDWPWPMRFAVVMVTWVPAYLSYRFVETPLRLPTGALRGLRRPALVGSLAAGATATAAVGILIVTPIPAWQPALVAQADPGPQRPGRPTPAPGPKDRVEPDPSRAREDLPQIYADGCHADFDVVDPPPCEYGVAPQRARLTVVLFGDSHAAQWFPALQSSATERSWRLVSMTKSGCPVADVTVWNRVTKTVYEQCDRYRTAALRRLADLRPDVVVAAEHVRGYSLVAEGQPVPVARSVWIAGLNRTVQRLGSSGTTVAMVADTPRPGFDVPACLARKPNDPDSCRFNRSDGLESREFDGLATQPTLRVVDLNDAICGPTHCPPVLANWLVYRDDNHLTASFARALRGPLALALDS